MNDGYVRTSPLSKPVKGTENRSVLCFELGKLVRGKSLWFDGVNWEAGAVGSLDMIDGVNVNIEIMEYTLNICGLRKVCCSSVIGLIPCNFVTNKMSHFSHKIDSCMLLETLFEKSFGFITRREVDEIIYIETEIKWR